MAPLDYRLQKRDIVYLAFIAFLVMLLTLLGRTTTDGELLRHVGLAGAVASIVLAVVAIVHTMISGSKSHDALANIQNAGQDLRDVADSIESQVHVVATEGKLLRETGVEVLKRSVEAAKGEMQDKTDGEVSAAGDVDLPLGLGSEWTSAAGLLILYALDLAVRSDKPCSPSLLAKLRGMGEDKETVNYSHGYMVGVQTGTRGRAAFGTEKTGWEVEVSPGVQEALSKVEAEIDKRIKWYNTSKKDRDAAIGNLLSECKLRTERHFLSEDSEASEDEDTEKTSEESDEGTE